MLYFLPCAFFATGIQYWVLSELYCVILITHGWQKEQAECDQSRWTCLNVKYIYLYFFDLEVGQTPGKWSPCGQSLSREDDILMDKSSDCVWKMSLDEEYGVKWYKKAPEKIWVYIVLHTCRHAYTVFLLLYDGGLFKNCHSGFIFFVCASATSVYLYIIITCAWRCHCLHSPPPPFFMASYFILWDLSTWDFVHGTVPERVLSAWVLVGFCWWDFAWGDSAHKDLFLPALCLKGFCPWGFCGGFSHWECAWRNSGHRDFFTWIFHKSFSPLGLTFWDLPDRILSTRIVSSDILCTGLLSAGLLCPQILPCGILSNVILSVPCMIYMTCGLVNPSLDGAVCEQRWCTFCSREEREPFSCQPFHSSHPSQGCSAVHHLRV